MARPLPIIAGVFRVSLMWAHNSGQTAVNVIHVAKTGGTAVGAANAIDAAVTTELWFNVSSLAHVTEQVVTPLDGSSATLHFPVTGTKWQGNASSSDMEPGPAAIVSLRTNNRGRRFRGRLFLPFQGEIGSANGVISTATTVSQAAWTAFVLALGTATYPLVIASYGYSLLINTRAHTISESTWTPFATPVATALVESTFGTQRRRQGRLR